MALDFTLTQVDGATYTEGVVVYSITAKLDSTVTEQSVTLASSDIISIVVNDGSKNIDYYRIFAGEETVTLNHDTSVSVGTIALSTDTTLQSVSGTYLKLSA